MGKKGDVEVFFFSFLKSFFFFFLRVFFFPLFKVFWIFFERFVFCLFCVIMLLLLDFVFFGWKGVGKVSGRFFFFFSPFFGCCFLGGFCVLFFC